MKNLLPLLAILLTLATSCRNPHGCQSGVPAHQEANSVYYWKTVLRLDSAERNFLSAHDVKRIYLRMFDVVADDGEWGAIPNASIQIPEREFQLLYEMDTTEIVPVVYITLDGLRAMADNDGELARNIVNRVANMSKYYYLPNVSEIQLDCDWTNSTRNQFFKLCDSVRASIKELQLPWRLSSTIRLHQLSQKAPPVDAGVLMVYNTGAFDNPDTRNSIIDYDDIEPYLNNLKSYPLHLDVAYPTYSWLLLFSNRKFIGIINELNLYDADRFEPQGENTFIVKNDFPYNTALIRKGDVIRRETSDFKEIEHVKREIEKRLAGREHSNIIYHLDPENLKNYTADEIQDIFAVGR
ncbi:MAG: hypothetical protein HDR86_08625 [Bacteroides sp.]|nr:hypothetical protein [Bacteroides sp.]